MFRHCHTESMVQTNYTGRRHNGSLGSQKQRSGSDALIYGFQLWCLFSLSVSFIISVVAYVWTVHGVSFGLVGAQDRLCWETQGCLYSCSVMQTSQVVEDAKYFQDSIGPPFLFIYVLWG